MNIHPFPSPVDTPTGTRASRGLGIVVFLSMVLLTLLGLVLTDEDVVQGSTVRLMYIHVPAAWVAYCRAALQAGRVAVRPVAAEWVGPAFRLCAR